MNYCRDGKKRDMAERHSAWQSEKGRENHSAYRKVRKSKGFAIEAEKGKDGIETQKRLGAWHINRYTRW